MSDEQTEAAILRAVSFPTADEVIARVEAAGLRMRTQQFFEAYAAETRKPHCGEHYRAFIAALLLRAQEVELYEPKEPT